MEKTIYLSFDLGLKGDYQGFYAWLDEREAKECGYNLAVFKYTYSGDSIVDSVKNELTSSVKFGKNDRLYMIWRDNGKIVGQFIVGHRKSSPWEGFALANVGVQDYGERKGDW